MKIRRLDVRNRRDVRRFIDFPFQLYARNDRWSPPLRSGVRPTLDRRQHPFYTHSDAPGLLVEGFEYEAVLAMPYNYDYYPRLLESNVKSLGGMNMLGVIWHKHRRVYRRTIAGPDAGER
jgi:hypothetical protein